MVTECEVRDAGWLQQIARTRWFTLRSVLQTDTHVCAYSDEYVQLLVRPGTIPRSITKGVITLLKKVSRYVWNDLDEYRPMTLLNIELKILARGPCEPFAACH